MQSQCTHTGKDMSSGGKGREKEGEWSIAMSARMAVEMVIVDIVESVCWGTCWLSILTTNVGDTQLIKIEGLSVDHSFGSFRQWSVGLTALGAVMR